MDALEPLDQDTLDRVERDALFAAILGMMSHVAAVMVCCIAPAGVAGIGLGLGSLYLSKKVLDSGVDGAPRAYATTSIIMSTIAILWCGFVVLCVCAYLTVYIGFIAAMGGGSF